MTTCRPIFDFVTAPSTGSCSDGVLRQALSSLWHGRCWFEHGRTASTASHRAAGSPCGVTFIAYMTSRWVFAIAAAVSPEVMPPTHFNSGALGPDGISVAYAGLTITRYLVPWDQVSANHSGASFDNFLRLSGRGNCHLLPPNHEETTAGSWAWPAVVAVGNPGFGTIDR